MADPRKQKKSEGVETFVDVAEVFAEEASGAGAVRRAWSKFKGWAAKDFIKKLDELEVVLQKQLEVNAALARTQNELFSRLNRKDEEIAMLKAKLERTDR